MTTPRAVNRATIGDSRSIAAVLSDAFDDDRVSGWLMPEAAERRRCHTRMFLTFVEHTLQQHTLRHGEVQVCSDGNGYTGAALWWDVDDGEQAAGPDIDKLREALGSDIFDRFLLLEELMTKHHPVGVRHAYLPFIGVTPHRQGQGTGRLMLETKLAELDQAGIPAYLEATSERSVRLYQRLGFHPLGDPFTLSDGGPPMWPMWRTAGQQHRWPVNSRRPGGPS